MYREGQGYSKAMGGTGIGTRMDNQINFLNPAAYSTQDTLSFILDFGVNYNVINYESDKNSIQRNNAGFSHLAISFPIVKWWVVSLGTAPYSKVGYNIATGWKTVPNVGNVVRRFSGSGGISRYYIGSGFKFENLSFGINANYLLGSIETQLYDRVENPQGTSVDEFANTHTENTYSIRNMSLSYGLQYSYKFNDNLNAVVGLTYEPKMKVNAYRDLYTYTQSAASGLRDTVVYLGGVKTGYDIPSKIGIGTSVDFKHRFLVCFDYLKQDWTDYKFPMSENDDLSRPTSSSSMNFGLQYTPNYRAIRGYLNHVNYRIGGHLTDTYMKINGEQIKDYGFSCGLGLPFLNSRSVFNISYEYGSLGSTDNGLVNQKYHFVNLNLTLYDFWFIKSKFD
jgi:hypothetical protein